MPLNILQITVPFMPGTSVNCYLVAVVEGFVLVDSGTARQRPVIHPLPYAVNPAAPPLSI